MNVLLRPLQEDDLLRVFAWHQNRLLFDMLVGHFRENSQESALNYMRRHWLTDDLRNLRMAICVGADERHVGNVSLLDIDPVNRSAEFHIFIGDAADRQSGIGYAATCEMLRRAFDSLNLHRVFLRVLSNNTAARKLYEKCGFQQEGVMREAAFKAGRFTDVIIMGCLSTEFRGR